jgi:hypothetical protein
MAKVANFNFIYDYSPVLLWQYSNAPNIKKIVENEQTFLNTAILRFEMELRTHIFALSTCDANGLDLWGRLLGVQRPVVDGVQFTDEQYRLLLQSRIALLVWDGSAYSLNKILRGLFPTAIFRVVDCPLDNLGNQRSMIVNLDFAGGLTAEQEAVLRLGYQDGEEFVYTFLPRPAGVQYNISFDDTWATTLGFEGMTETTNMGGAYDCDPDDHTGETGTENADGGVFYK